MEHDPVVTELHLAAHEWDRAMVRNDPLAIGRFMVDDWVLVGTDGGTIGKDPFLALIREGRLVHDTMTTEGIEVRRHGDVAVLVADGVSGGTFDAQPFRERERQSNVFVRRDGRWQCVLTHLSRLPAAPAPPVNAPAPPPLACTLSPSHQQCRANVLLPALGARAVRSEWTPDGVAFTFTASSEHLKAIAETIDQERECCAFLRFRLDVPPAGAHLVLDVSGPAGAREFLRGLGVTGAGA